MDRPAYLAGAWYPGEPDACRLAVEEHVRGAPSGKTARGAIGPHAGWTYSGDCAGKTLAALAASRREVPLVVIFGSHRGPHDPSTVFVGDGFETPLGRLGTHRLAARVKEALALPDEPVRPMRPDNAVELHLPFVRALFPKAELVMLGVAATEDAARIGRTVGALAKEAGDDAVFIGSTDLTHYGPNYHFSPAGGGEDAVRWVREVNDAGFLDALLADRPRDALAHATEHRSACCPGAVLAAFEAVRAYGDTPRPELVSHTLSYDVRPSTSFVGYGGLLL